MSVMRLDYAARLAAEMDRGRWLTRQFFAGHISEVERLMETTGVIIDRGNCAFGATSGGCSLNSAVIEHCRADRPFGRRRC